MDTDGIRQALEGGLTDLDMQMEADVNKISLLLVSPSFEGLNRVKRQQLVYKLLNDRISSGEVHAVMMKTLTPAENADG